MNEVVRLEELVEALEAKLAAFRKIISGRLSDFSKAYLQKTDWYLCLIAGSC
jgi:hypothetical protein